MNISWRDLPGPARGVGTAIARAVDAAGDLDDYEAASAELSGQPQQAVGTVLAAVVRALLEERHPDGLDGDDIAAVLAASFGAASRWLPADRLDASVLIAVLASALGVHEPGVTYDEIGAPVPRGDDEWRDPTSADEVPMRAPTPAEYAWIAPVLIADLLGGRRLNPYLDAAFAEIYTSESMEMP
jgi:hypothetical protein